MDPLHPSPATELAAAPDARLFQQQSSLREIAFLDERPFNSVTGGDIADAEFTTGLIGVPFKNDDTVLLKTDTGDIFKIGNPVELGDFGPVTFEYRLLTVMGDVAIVQLILDVDAINLANGIGNALDNKLENALDAWLADNADQRNDVINKMEACINSVEAQRGNKMTEPTSVL